METELQLLTAIRSGQDEGLRHLYDRFAGLAMATGLRYVPDPEQARDIVQDSFVSILTSLDDFHYRGEGSLRAWVTSIVAHQAIDYLKRRGRLVLTDRLPEDALTDEPEVGRIPPSVLNALIGKLPTGYRTVLNLYVFEQMTHKEIARLLGIKRETSASQYSRAKNMLARLINNYLKNNKL